MYDTNLDVRSRRSAAHVVQALCFGILAVLVPVSTPAQSQSCPPVAVPIAAPCPNPLPCASTILAPTITQGIWSTVTSPVCINPTGAGPTPMTVTMINITIPPNFEIRVAPSVTLSLINVTAIGTATLPIRFTAMNPAARWGGLLFQNTSQPPGPYSTLQHCRVELAESSGIRIIQSNPIIRFCFIDNNSTGLSPNSVGLPPLTGAGNGGGISINVGTGNLTFEDCEIANNQSSISGGGVYANLTSGSVLTLRRCRLSNNGVNPTGAYNGGAGGGLRVVGDSVLENCLFESNDAYGYCFGWYGCTAVAQGGAIHSAGGVTTLKNCVLAGNAARAKCETHATCTYTCSVAPGGGGLYLASGSLVATNSFLICNSTCATSCTNSVGGGALEVASGNATIQNCTVVQNNSVGIANAAGTVSVDSSIVYFNYPSSSTSPPFSGVVSADASDIQVAGGLIYPWSVIPNVNVTPPFAVGSGCSASSYALIDPGFPYCVDQGNPAVAFNDISFPPSAGSSRNDMGATGGPGAAAFQSPCTIRAGANVYGSDLGASHSLTLRWTPSTLAGGPGGTLSINGATPASVGILGASLAPAATQACPFVILVSTTGLVPLVFPFDGTGSVSFVISLAIPALIGTPVFLQAAEFDAAGLPVSASNGLQLIP